MAIDRNRILCALAIAAGLLPFSGCSNSDKSPATPESVTNGNLNAKPDPGVVNVSGYRGETTKTLPVEIIDDSKSAPSKSGAKNMTPEQANAGSDFHPDAKNAKTETQK